MVTIVTALPPTTTCTHALSARTRTFTHKTSSMFEGKLRTPHRSGQCRGEIYRGQGCRGCTDSPQTHPSVCAFDSRSKNLVFARVKHWAENTRASLLRPRPYHPPSPEFFDRVTSALRGAMSTLQGRADQLVAVYTQLCMHPSCAPP